MAAGFGIKDIQSLCSDIKKGENLLKEMKWSQSSRTMARPDPIHHLSFREDFMLSEESLAQVGQYR